MARLRVDGVLDGIEVADFLTIYKDIERVDLDFRIHKPPTTAEQRLTQSFPAGGSNSEVRLETMGAVIRPSLQPQGDLLPGADTRRFAVQGFVDVSNPDGEGLTISPQEAFFLRTDLGMATFEVLGNDQDFKEMTKNQDGVTDFRFRYSIRTHERAFDNAATVGWSRSVTNPLIAARGHLVRPVESMIGVDPSRAIAIGLKPAEDGGTLVRLWETSGKPGAITLHVAGFSKAVATDLLERPLQPLTLANGNVEVHINANGFAAVQLTR